MKKKLTLRWALIKLAGVFFAAFAAYNVFIFIRDYKRISSESLLITAVITVLFAALAFFAWTSEIKRIQILMIRTVAFIIAMLGIFAFKLRMAGQVFAYLDMSKVHTIIYVVVYVLTQAALLSLIVYYIFIVKNLPQYPRLSVFLPSAALLLFLISFALEIILFFVFGIGMETNALRTMVMRPVFFLGFIALTVYFLFPPKELKDSAKDDFAPTQDEVVMPEEIVIPDEMVTSDEVVISEEVVMPEKRL